MAVVAHAPWLLWAIEVLLHSGSPRRRWMAGCFVALATGSQLLLGHPQAFWLSAFLEAAYALYRARVPQHFKRLTALGLAKALGVVIGAVQLLPTMEAVEGSVRFGTEEFRDRGALHPANLLQWIEPYLFEQRVLSEHLTRFATHELGIYLGVLTPVLVVWLWIRRREIDPARRGLLRAALVAAITSLILACGRYLPWVHGIVTEIPLLSLFRASCRYSVLAQFAGSILCAIAIEDLARTKRPLAWRALWPLAVVPVCSSTSSAALGPASER